MLIATAFCADDILYDSDDDRAHGIRISANDHFLIFAVNKLKIYSIVSSPYDNQSPCSIVYPVLDDYVYSLAAIYNPSDANANDTFLFIQLAENMVTTEVVLSLIRINRSICSCKSVLNAFFSPNTRCSR